MYNIVNRLLYIFFHITFEYILIQIKKNIHLKYYNLNYLFFIVTKDLALCVRQILLPKRVSAVADAFDHAEQTLYNPSGRNCRW